jgi:hypothetical protein
MAGKFGWAADSIDKGFVFQHKNRAIPFFIGLRKTPPQNAKKRNMKKTLKDFFKFAEKLDMIRQG